jgi:hypothetical protein
MLGRGRFEPPNDVQRKGVVITVRIHAELLPLVQLRVLLQQLLDEVLPTLGLPRRDLVLLVGARDLPLQILRGALIAD